MAARKRAGRAAGPPLDRALVLVGAVRPAPLAVEDAGRRYTPEIAVWVVPESGLIWGMSLGPPGRGAATLLEALLAPGPPPFAAGAGAARAPGAGGRPPGPAAPGRRSPIPGSGHGDAAAPGVRRAVRLALRRAGAPAAPDARPPRRRPGAALRRLRPALAGQTVAVRRRRAADRDPAPPPAPTAGRPRAGAAAVRLRARRRPRGVRGRPLRLPRRLRALPHRRPVGPARAAASPEALLARLRRRALLVSFDPDGGAAAGLPRAARPRRLAAPAARGADLRRAGRRGARRASPRPPRRAGRPWPWRRWWRSASGTRTPSPRRRSPSSTRWPSGTPARRCRWRWRCPPARAGGPAAPAADSGALPAHRGEPDARPGGAEGPARPAGGSPARRAQVEAAVAPAARARGGAHRDVHRRPVGRAST